MVDMESERKGVVRSRKKLNPTQRNVILGVATVAGLGLVGKLLSVLRREKPKKQRDKDVETLESVLSEGKRSNVPLQAQVQRTKLANLDNDEPDHEVVNRKRNARRSKYADSFSEIISEDDITKEGEMYVSQDPVGRRDRDRTRETRDARRDANASPNRKGKQLSVSEGGGFNIKGMSHSNAENRGKRHEEDGDEHHSEHLSTR